MCVFCRKRVKLLDIKNVDICFKICRDARLKYQGNILCSYDSPILPCYTPMPMTSMSLPMPPPMFPSYDSSYESSYPSFAPRVPSYVPFNSFVTPVAPIPSYALMPSDVSLLCHYPLTYLLLCPMCPTMVIIPLLCPLCPTIAKIHIIWYAIPMSLCPLL